MAASLNGVVVELKYLFEAHFANGPSVFQTKEDKSLIDPDKRSAFYDVSQRIDDIIIFGLYNDEHTYVVDLRDGHFEIDKVPFYAQPSTSNNIPEGGKYKLLYFRDHQQDFIVDQGNGQCAEGEHRVMYRLGWEYEVAGKTYQQTILFS